MGRALVQRIWESAEATLSGGSVPVGDALEGREIGILIQEATPGVSLTSDAQALLEAADAVIDFTAPEYSLALARIAANLGKIHICGTTGLSEAQKASLQAFAGKARIVWSANMSIGVNLLAGLVEQAAALLPGAQYDIEIDEMHHRFKQDSPSGTALMLARAAQTGRAKRGEEAKTLYPHPVSARRESGIIGMSARRGGDVVGDHTVTFAGLGERLELAHKASDRSVFAGGALRAALWAREKPPGFYTMRDVLGL
jgi:4-hydroxy-tetrahydrodipicolinate reductase